MTERCSCALSLGVLLLTLLTTTLTTAQRPASRITQQINPKQRVTLQGNTHPLARAEFDRGPAPDSLMADRMMLVLSRSDEQEKALRQLLDDQQTAGSPNFHKWLTPEEFGQQFGPSDTDIETVKTWLLNNGFQVTNVSPGRNVVEFSGNAGQLRQVFHTDLHKYVVNGQEHWANANDPQIPSALASVVKGIASLNNFGRRPQSHNVRAFKRDAATGEASPLMTTGGSPAYYLIGPGDFGIIYNSTPLIQAGYDGTGQKIAIAGRTNINLHDVTDFRNLFGLPNTPDNHTTIILNGPDPGILDGDETEALLDVEWAGATAPGASVILVTTESTLTADGIDLSALYIVENNLAPVMSVSYGSCEAGLGNAGNLFYQSLWEQAAAQGITVNVAAGDNGSAACDDPNTETVAQHGTAVNGIASTPFNIAVGGTDFNDSSTQTTYFNSTNTSGTWTSAKSYIPEMPWNDSCAGGASPTTSSCTSSSNLQLWAGSGGPSTCSKLSGSTCSGYSKPSWQTGTGVPADGVRDLPDISLFAASGSAGSRSLYVMCEADLVPGNPSCQNPGTSGGYVYLVTIAGTSASSPAFAGAVALANQKVGHRLGNLNYLLYSITAQSGATCPSSSSTSSCVFHDVTIGGNSVPCKAGTPKCSATTSGNGVLVDSGKLAYLAGTGYDRATGLGTPDINNLVTKIAAASFTPTTTTLTLNGGIAQVNASHGQSINVVVGVSPTAATGDVSLIGNNGTTDNSGFDFFKLSSGAASWSSTLFPGGTYTVHAHYPGDGSRGASDSGAVSVNIAPENSKTFVNLVTPSTFTATSAEYGSPYILRMDVGDSAATISSSTGVSSKCTNGTASCPTGTLAVTANGNSLDGGNWKLNNLGYAEDQPIQLTPGTYNIAASYPGDASYNASSGNTNLTINKATTALAASTPATTFEYGVPILLNATLASTSNGAAPGGAIAWLDNGTNAGQSINTLYFYGTPAGNSGYASATYSGDYTPPSLGTHTLTAQYSGDSNYASANAAPLTFTISKASMRANVYQITPTQSTPTIPVTLYVYFTSQSWISQPPTGTISFYDNGTLLPGTVTYSIGQSSLSGTLTYTFQQTGQHTISAAFSGDTYYAPASQTLGTLSVNTKLTPIVGPYTALNPAVVNYTMNLYASVASPTYNLPSVTGTVTFSDNGQPLSGNVTYSGTSPLIATLPYSFTSSGTHNITATYSGDNNYLSGSGALSLNVLDKFSTTIPSLNGSTNFVVNAPSTLSVTVMSNAGNQGPVMTGTVTFTDGSTSLTGTPTVSNLAGQMIVQLPYTFTALGTHNITAQYSGDDHYAASSKSVSVDVMGPLALRFPYNDAREAMGSYSALLYVYNNTSTAQTVTLTCQSSSTSVPCTPSPATLAVPPNGMSYADINFTLPALSGSVRHNQPFGVPLVFAAILAGVSIIRTKKSGIAVLSLIVMVGILLASCGGGSSSGGTVGGGGGGNGGGGGGQTSATYTFTVTGTAGANTDTQVFKITEVPPGT